MTEVIRPRADGLVSRNQAAALCGVTSAAITNWATVGYGPKDAKVRLPVAKRIRGRPYFDPVELAKAEAATRKRARRQEYASVA